MKTAWRTFEDATSGLKVEAQVFHPLADTPDVVLFCPGFPGMGATRFEQRHAATLVHEGYAVVVLRHAGTKLDGPAAPAMINNAMRLAQARRRGEALLGGAPSTIETWLMEPYVALKALDAEYTKIHVIGNSFGAVAALWSMTEDDAPLAKLRTLLLQAGAQGVADSTPESIMRVWLPAFIDAPQVTDKVALEPGIQVSKTMHHVYENLPRRVMEKIPANIPMTYLVVRNDEILTPRDSERFREAIGGRGDIVMDEIDRAHPAHGLLAHDMPDYPTEYILDILQARDPKGGLGAVPPFYNPGSLKE